MDDTNQQTNKQPSLLEELGLNNLPGDEKEALVEDMTETVLQRVFTRVIPQLKEEDNKVLDKLADSDNAEEEVLNYLAEKVPDFEKIIEEETQKYGEEVKSELLESKAAVPTPINNT